MSFSKRKVLSLWQQNNRLSINLQEIHQTLGASKKHTENLSAILTELVGEGLLTFQQKQYRLVAPTRPPLKQKAPPSEEIQGVFSAHRNGFGFIDLKDAEGRSFFVPPPHIGGALDQDVVKAVLTADRGTRTTARITGVIKRGRTLVRGYVEKELGHAWVVPLNEKLPAVQLEQTPVGMEWDYGNLVEARITHYPNHPDHPPLGQVVRLLDEDDSPEHILDHILADAQVFAGFSPQTEAEMALLPPEVVHPPERTDLRDLCFVTIDGEDAKDFDDAVCLIDGKNGTERLLVAIADVTAYVKPGMATDTDAYEKGTSIYLPNRVLPMLPEALSNELCSLKPLVPRLALVCDMELDKKGELADYRIYEATILSQARLTYNQVHRYLETGGEDEIPSLTVRTMLTRMGHLAKTLAHQRYTRGAVAMELPETRFVLGADGLPEKVIKVYPNQATKLIEQFMLEANETVAKHASKSSIPILFRVHDPPREESLYNLTVLLANFNLEVSLDDIQSQGGLNRLLLAIENHPQRDQVEIAILRSMSQAQYRHLNGGHYGLAATYYTHFTSPIRRYPDLLLHRALKSAASAAKRDEISPFALPADAGPHLSTCERQAQAIETKVIRLFRVLYMEKYLGQEFQAQVTGASDGGLWLEITEHNVDGFLPMEALPDDTYRLDKGKNILMGKRTGREVGFGTRLEVRLAVADRHTHTLE
ncbi:MAG: ribonuclease R, partial [Deltaproteobacteria bacterium]|nr:ribonuclease R [Deltaproteobacteria bacterium]